MRTDALVDHRGSALIPKSLARPPSCFVPHCKWLQIGGSPLTLRADCIVGMKTGIANKAAPFGIVVIFKITEGAYAFTWELQSAASRLTHRSGIRNNCDTHS